jgi:hypothetical protein
MNAHGPPVRGGPGSRPESADHLDQAYKRNAKSSGPARPKAIRPAKFIARVYLFDGPAYIGAFSTIADAKAASHEHGRGRP